MNFEVRTCQNCKSEFRIDPEDFGFYERIKVPPPTFCPECRLERRYAWRNERALYKAKCGNCSKDIFSTYPADSPFPVFCKECWYSDAWDPFMYGQEYDFSRPFFDQFQELLSKVPRLNLFHTNATNSPYANSAVDVKNAYLSYSVVRCEDIFYSKNIDDSKEMFDCFSDYTCEQCFETLFGEKNYGVRNSIYVHACVDSAFLFDCTNASNCFMSANLRNAQFMIRNTQYSKEGYFEELARIDMGSRRNYGALQREFHEMTLRYPHKYTDILKSVNSTGDTIANAKNSKEVFEAYDMENVSYAGRMFKMKDSMDINNTSGGERIYEHVTGGKSDRNCRFSIESLLGLSDVEYSGRCGSSSNLFGCFGIRGKQYCILNRQYSKEEYEALIPKIRAHMDDMPYEGKNGRVYRYGEFFPIELSPFAYNESIAQEHFHRTKEEVEARGYRWREPEARNPQIDIASDDLPDHIKDVPEDIITKTIGCAHSGKCLDQCTVAFRVVPQELDFYRTKQIPLPRLCPNCRHYERLKFRNPWKLWHRGCECAGTTSKNGVYANTATHSHGEVPCAIEFESPYAPEKPEIVYCEDCYQQEVV